MPRAVILQSLYTSLRWTTYCLLCNIIAVQNYKIPLVFSSVHVVGSSKSFFMACSWIQQFGEEGLQCLLKHLREACEKTGNVEKRIQHECVRCLKAFMNNKVNNIFSNELVMCCVHVFVHSEVKGFELMFIS